MYKCLCFLIGLGLLTACVKENQLEIDVSDVVISTTVKRFDQDFYKADVRDLGTLKKTYPYLFPSQTPDSIWAAKMVDADELELFGETEKLYANFTEEAEELEDLFRHIKYYYPDFRAPKVITLLSNVNYEQKVTYADSLLLISIDVYLGKESVIYQDFPDYIKHNFTKEHMLVDVAEAITDVQIPLSKDRTFVSRMIQEGKRMYLLDAYLPLTSDAEKMGYAQAQIDWADFNDEDIWKFFVQNKMLFSTAQDLNARFLEEAPFSKFYQANDSESPGRIGVWFGWQIVRSYMKHNKTDLQDLLKINNDEIFKKSKYKPSK